LEQNIEIHLELTSHPLLGQQILEIDMNESSPNSEQKGHGKLLCVHDKTKTDSTA
jgi:hypothetical protein